MQLSVMTVRTEVESNNFMIVNSAKSVISKSHAQ